LHQASVEFKGLWKLVVFDEIVKLSVKGFDDFFGRFGILLILMLEKPSQFLSHLTEYTVFQSLKLSQA